MFTLRIIYRNHKYKIQLLTVKAAGTYSYLSALKGVTTTGRLLETQQINYRYRKMGVLLIWWATINFSVNILSQRVTPSKVI
jgi:hypothetical protein